jgi:PAS domain S-box-containing protein
MIVDVVRTHPIVLVGGVLQENPFYVPPDQFLAELRSREAGSGGSGAESAAAPKQDLARLSDTLRDLVALGTLSALESRREPGVVVERFAHAGLSFPFVDVVYVKVESPSERGGIEVLRAKEDLLPPPSAADLERAWRETSARGNAVPQRLALEFPGSGQLSLFAVPLGPQARYGWMAAGSRTPGFPDTFQRAMLEIGAQQLSAVLRERHLADLRAAETALRQSEERFRSAFEDATVGMALLTPEGRFVQVNPALGFILGRSESQLLGADCASVTHPDDVPALEDALRQIVAGEREGVILVKRCTHPDGAVVWVQSSLSLAHAAGGRPAHVVALVEDITDRRRAEVERARLDSITDAALAHLSLDDLLSELLARLRNALRADIVTLRLVDESAREFVLRAVDGVPFERVAGIRIPLDSSFPTPLDSPFLINDLPPPEPGRDDWYARVWSLLDLPLRATMGVPLLVEGKQIGVLSLAATRTPFTKEDQRILQVVADRVAPVIERGRLVETLGESRRRLAALSERLVDVQETERRDIARELHDEVGQLLTGLLFKIEGYGAGTGDTKGEMKAIVDDLIDRVRNLSMNLRPPMLDDLGLLSALTWQIERFEAQTGIRVRFHHADLDRRFGAQAEITAFRIVQEALTNVARHAGVREASVDVWADAASLGVRIEDQGRGFDVAAARAARSSGLEGMRERSRLAGGHLAIESKPGQGARLSVELPLDPSLRKEDHG